MFYISKLTEGKKEENIKKAVLFYIDLFRTKGSQEVQKYWPKKYSSKKTLELPFGRVPVEALYNHLTTGGKTDKDVILLISLMMKENVEKVKDTIKSGAYWTSSNVNFPTPRLLDPICNEFDYDEIKAMRDEVYDSWTKKLDSVILKNKTLVEVFGIVLGSKDRGEAESWIRDLYPKIWNNKVLDSNYFQTERQGTTSGLSNFIYYVQNYTKIDSIKPIDFEKTTKDAYKNHRSELEDYFKRIIDSDMSRDIISELIDFSRALKMKSDFVQDKFNKFKKTYKKADV